MTFSLMSSSPCRASTPICAVVALLFFFCLCALFPTIDAETKTEAPSKLFGVLSKHMDSYMKAQEGGVFECLTSGEKIDFSRVNDGNCDCRDGSDEPGTTACLSLSGMTLPHVVDGWFFACTNHTVGEAFTHSAINDGICDCCDGSDEYSSGVECPNTCAQKLTKRSEEEVARQERVAIAKVERERLHDKAVAGREGRVKELQELKAQLSVLAERLEILQAKNAALFSDADITSEGQNIEGDALKRPSVRCVMWRQTANCDPNGPREPSQDASCSTDIYSHRSGYCECDTSPDMAADADQYFDEVADDLDLSDAGEDGDEEMERAVAAHRSAHIIRYNFSCAHVRLTCARVCENGGDPSESPADIARNELAELETQVSKKRTAVEKAEAVLGSGLNIGDYLRALEGQEYRIESNTFVYTMKLFGEITQSGKSEGGYTVIGNWKEFANSTYSLWSKDKLDYSTMLYDNGFMCYNGMTRRTEVKVVCGPHHKLIDVVEPSICQYKLVFETPAACTNVEDMP